MKRDVRGVKMSKRKKLDDNEEVIKIEKRKNNISEEFYYLLGIVLALVLIFATEEFLSTINYLFVVIFAIVAVIQLINFIMNKEYERKNYTYISRSIVCIWLALFIFQYGNFLFLEMLPILLSLILSLMAISSLTKYFDFRNKGNLIITIISLVLAVLLMFIPRDIIYIIFKITGFYILVMFILDFIDYKKHYFKI